MVFSIEWFLKSLYPYIAKYVTLFEVTTIEQDIFKAQKLDLVYFQCWMWYDILPIALRVDENLTQPNPRSHAEGVTGLV